MCMVLAFSRSEAPQGMAMLIPFTLCLWEMSQRVCTIAYVS